MKGESDSYGNSSGSDLGSIMYVMENPVGAVTELALGASRDVAPQSG
jgi:hypothetical protein